MLPSRSLTDTDTIPALAREGLAEAKAAKEAARAAKMADAKNNLQFLMAAGVVITCDDELDNHYRYMAECARAKQDGISISEARARMELERAEEDVRQELRGWVQGNESTAEFYARRDAAQATATGLLDNGKPCKHRATARLRGWHNMNMYESFCCRCGARVEMHPPTEPTEQAKIAARILAQEG